MESEEAETLFRLVKEKYGDKIKEDELEEVKKAVERIVETSMELRRSAGIVSRATFRWSDSGEGMRSPLMVVELSLASVPRTIT